MSKTYTMVRTKKRLLKRKKNRRRTGGKAVASGGKAVASGGKAVASGAYGCVFDPALRCSGVAKREKGTVSKFMKSANAEKEYEIITRLKDILSVIPHFEDYFLLKATKCQPQTLTKTDLEDFSKCGTVFKNTDVDKKNINERIEQYSIINMPHGGLPIDDHLYENGSFQKIYELHLGLLRLLKKGIIPMNRLNIYHCDIKDSNILVSDKPRLIDWGLNSEYVPFVDAPFPSAWRNRPLQYNVPFSVILFSDTFVNRYTKFIKGDGNEPTEELLKPFITEYVQSWMADRGAGHYKFIISIMELLFSNEYEEEGISKEDLPGVIEKDTMDYIVNYLVDVLVHFTHFKEDGTLNMREYLDNVFIKIVDIYGFITTYYPVLEMLSNNYKVLQKMEIKIFKHLQFIFVEYLYNPRHEPYDMCVLLTDFEDLGKHMHIKNNGTLSTYKTPFTASPEKTASPK